MALENRPFSFLFMIVILFTFFFILAGSPKGLIGSPEFPSIAPEMERSQYWIKKLKKPDHIFLSARAIERMNEENLKRQDLHLFRIRDLKEDWKGEEILQFLEEDWENFGNTQGRRYSEKGASLSESFWNELRNRMDRESIQKQARLIYALIVKRADVRVFPTDQPSNRSPSYDEFDRFQHASLSPGSP